MTTTIRSYPTIGERINDFHAQQEHLDFPPGSEAHERASRHLERMRPVLIQAMSVAGLTLARTKIATATLKDGVLTVEKYEVSM